MIASSDYSRLSCGSVVDTCVLSSLSLDLISNAPALSFSILQIDVKMGCDVQEFVKMTNCYVADVVHDEEETTLGE